MRVLALILALSSVASATEDDGDDGDDPKRGTLTIVSSWRTRPTPRIDLGYRFFWTNGLGDGRSQYHTATIDAWPCSRIFRFGISAELGFADDAYHSWFGVLGLAIGLQYPAQVTPFIEARGTAGVLVATIAGQQAPTWVVLPGVDAGVDFYATGRLHVGVAVGWLHPVYEGVDLASLHAGKIVPKQFDNDTFTVKVIAGM